MDFFSKPFLPKILRMQINIFDIGLPETAPADLNFFPLCF